MRKFQALAVAAAMTAGSLFADVQIGKGLSVGGYLDMYFQQADADNIGGAGAPSASGFTVANAQIDFMMDFGSGLTARVDLDSSNYGIGGGVAVAGGTAGNAGLTVEQARIDYAMGQGTLTLGKFDTFIGLEGLEAPDLYQFSNSNTWAYEPGTHEGLAYTFDNGNFNFAFAIVNGIANDNGSTSQQAAAAPAVGDYDGLAYAAHVGFTPSDALSFNLNYAAGENELESPVPLATDLDVTILTIDASYSNHGWTVGAEYVDREDETITPGAASATVDTKAWMLMVNYMFSEQFGLTGRYSVADEDFGAYELEGKEFTLAASYAMTPNWSALIEYRSEEYDGAPATAPAGSPGHTASGALYAGAGQEADIITVETILTF